MTEWLKAFIPHYDSTIGALIGAVVGIGMYMAGRWAVYRDRMTHAEEKRWNDTQQHLHTHDDKFMQIRLQMSQMMTRDEIMDALNESVIRSGNNVGATVSAITARLDRMDVLADRMEQRRAARDKELLDTVHLLLNKTDRRREDYAPRPTTSRPVTDEHS